VPKTGVAFGTCSRCGKTLTRERPVTHAVCDCYKYCPVDHGKGAYGSEMTPYTPDLNPQTYGPLKRGESAIWGDTDHPMHILYCCSICNYHSSQTAVEVELE